MKSLVITSILGLSLSLPLRAGAQEQPAAPAQEQPAVPAQEQPAAPAPEEQAPLQAQPEAPLPQEQPPPQAQLPALQLQAAPLASPTVATAADVPALKSPGAARAWALSSTALSVGMLATGLVGDQEELAWLGLIGLTVGPSFGHFYAGDAGRALGQIGLRVGALGVMYTGLVVAVFECGFFIGDSGCRPSGGSTLVVGGLALGVGSVVYSIYDAPRAAKRYNARQQRLTFTPAPIVGPDRTSGLGLQLGGTF